MSDAVKPALTAEEWADYPNWPLAKRADGEEPPLYFPTRHGIAAANLHGQPFGFTREDVRKLSVLRVDAEMGPADDGTFGSPDVENAYLWLESLAARIQALLPPEPTHERQG